jgi:hypothetical protein
LVLISVTMSTSLYTCNFNDSYSLEHISSAVHISLPLCVLAFDKYFASGCTFQINGHCEGY